MEVREKVSEEEIARLKEAMPEVLATKLGIMDLARPFRCPDPEHDDKTPSAHYYAKGSYVKCFGCGGIWDVFDLVGMTDNIPDFPSQVRAVAEIAGTEIEGAGGDVRQQARTVKPTAERPAPLDLSETCMGAFEALYTPEGNAARTWLLETRGITDDDIARHGLGLTLRPKDVAPEFSVYEPDAAAFVVVPFWDDEGCTRASYAMLRTVPKPGTRARVKEWRPKDVRSRVWQGWTLRSGLPEVCLTEGPLDAIALQKLMGTPCAALGGTSMAKAVVRGLAKIPKDQRPRRLIVCMDADVAGKRTAEEISSSLTQIGLPHSVLPGYPGGVKDADDWLVAERGRIWEAEENESLKGIRTMTGTIAPLTRTKWRRVSR